MQHKLIYCKEMQDNGVQNQLLPMISPYYSKVLLYNIHVEIIIPRNFSSF